MQVKLFTLADSAKATSTINGNDSKDDVLNGTNGADSIDGDPMTHVVEVDDGAHELDVRVGKGAQPRLFGVSLERGTNGVIYDALGINGALVNATNPRVGIGVGAFLTLATGAMLIRSYRAHAVTPS